ncbi:MAG: fumarate hydratase C-terminal domain-containing protein, partial [Desulfohalobium sp.]
GVRQALQDYGGVYFGATGGAGALLAQRILSARVIAYPDLGPEAIRELEVADFPVVVANDCHGGELYARAQRSGRS